MLCKTSRWDPTIYTVIGWTGALNYFYSYSDLDKDNNITFNRTLGVLKTPIIVMGGCLSLPLFNFLSIVGKYLSFKTVMVLYKLFWKSGLYQLCTIWWTEINEDFIFVPNDRGGLILIISTYFITTNSFLDQVFLVKFPLKFPVFWKIIGNREVLKTLRKSLLDSVSIMNIHFLSKFCGKILICDKVIVIFVF